MKTAKSIIVVLFVLLTAQIASAYYCPSTGRWLSRDPIGEPGFQTSQMASVVPKSPQPASNRWINRDPLEKRGEPNLSAMAKNNLINKIDALGLITDESLTGRAEWQCKPCKCKSVTVTYVKGSVLDIDYSCREGVGSVLALFQPEFILFVGFNF